MLLSVTGSTPTLLELGAVLRDDLNIAISSSPLIVLDEVLAGIEVWFCVQPDEMTFSCMNSTISADHIG